MIELEKETIKKKGGINTMKRKSLLYIIITLVMLLQMSVGIVASDEIIVDDLEVIIETDFDLIVDIVTEESELQPVPASASAATNIVKFSSSAQANSVAQSCGYDGAESMKADFGFGSNANLGYDKNTREIYIIPTNGACPQATGYYW